MEWARPFTGSKIDGLLQIVDAMMVRNVVHLEKGEPVEKMIIMIESRYYIHAL